MEHNFVNSFYNTIVFISICTQTGLELPGMNYKFNGKKYRYFYGSRVEWTPHPNKVVSYQCILLNVEKWVLLISHWQHAAVCVINTYTDWEGGHRDQKVHWVDREGLLPLWACVCCFTRSCGGGWWWEAVGLLLHYKSISSALCHYKNGTFIYFLFSGVILTSVVSLNPKKSPFMLVLNAKTFEEIARASIDASIHLDLHGHFIPTQSTNWHNQHRAGLYLNIVEGKVLYPTM